MGATALTLSYRFRKPAAIIEPVFLRHRRRHALSDACEPGGTLPNPRHAGRAMMTDVLVPASWQAKLCGWISI